MPKRLDFEGLARALVERSRDIVPALLPGGQIKGKEYCCADIKGGKGTSFKVNLDTGKWADFAVDQSGKDLIGLWAEVENIKQGEAAKRAAREIGYDLRLGEQGPVPKGSRIARSTPNTPAPEEKYIPPPKDAPKPRCTLSKLGKPTGGWAYRAADGSILFYVVRYDPPGGKKDILPWSWDSEQSRWIPKSHPRPRPLFALPGLARHPDRPVMIVEGEKCAVAAERIVGKKYSVTTWPGGSKAWRMVDWSPIYGRKILLWPDSDDFNKRSQKFEGLVSMLDIGKMLEEHCPEVKILAVDAKGGWDSANALEQGWDWDRFFEWAKPRVVLRGDWEKTNPSPDTPPIPVDVERIPDELAKVPPEVTDAQAEGAMVESDSVPIPTEDNQIKWERLGLAMSKGGYPVANVDNALRVLERLNSFDGRVWWDEFLQQFLTTIGDQGIREWADNDDLNVLVFMQRGLGISQMSDEKVHKAISVYAKGKDDSGKPRVRNAPKDWLTSLKWDGNDRIEAFFAEWMGVAPCPYSMSVSKNFWIGLVARIFKPGCQVDNMIVIEGKQGSGKTQACKAIGGEWYTDAHEQVDSKDFYMSLRGKLLIEISELESFRRAQMSTLKQVISSMTDRYRAPYERRPQDHPRMCVFAGTTNRDDYMGDVTGGRRFWPLVSHRIDLKGIKIMREQFFAESLHRFRDGELWYQTPHNDTMVEQEKRRRQDEWEYIILDYLGGRAEEGKLLKDKGKVLLVEVWKEALGGEPVKFNKPDQLRVADCMRALGWIKKDSWLDGSKKKFWIQIPPPVVQGNGH